MDTEPGKFVRQSVIAASLLIVLHVPMSGSAQANEIGDASANTPKRQVVDDIFEVMTQVLPGRWSGENAHGTADNPTSDWEATTVEYVVTAGGSALIENYTDNAGQPYMTTVYHKDNNDLRATHYCGAENHPRMIARRIDTETKVVSFDFVDIANLESVDSYHSRGLDLQIVSANSIVLTFTGLQDGKSNSRVFRFRKDEE